MDKFYVLRGHRVVYRPGHNDEEGAVRTAKQELKVHPRSVVTVAKVVAEYSTQKKDTRPWPTA